MSNLKNFLFTSESVSEGHPDKVSDRISDMVVDSFISKDPYSRVATTKKDLLGKKLLKLKVIYILNLLILLWEWIHREIKMKGQEIKV